MIIIFTKGDAKYSYLKCIRDDQTITETMMPEQGIMPHDMLHYIVEKQLAFEHAFYGQLKAGADIDFKLKHNQLSQEHTDIDQTESRQSECIVEALQSVLCSGNFDYDSFTYRAKRACEFRGIPMPNVNKSAFLFILNECYQLNQKWKRTSTGEAISVIF